MIGVSRDSRARKRGWRLAAAIGAAACVLLATLGAIQIGKGHKRPGACAPTVQIAIGFHPDLEEGRRAALSKLASELQRCPLAGTYIVFRSSGILAAIDDTGREGTTYFSDKRRIQDYNVGEGLADEDWSGVTVEALLSVAARHGTFRDLLRYGAHPTEL